MLVENNTIVVSQTISPINLTRPVLAQALTSVATAARDLGVLAVVHGGHTPNQLAAPVLAD